MNDVTLATQSVDLPEVVAIKEKLIRLQDSLQQNLPGYDSLLFMIHQALSKQPDLVHMMKPEEVATIVAGLEKKTGLLIMGEQTKSKAASKKISLDI